MDFYEFSAQVEADALALRLREFLRFREAACSPECRLSLAQPPERKRMLDIPPDMD